MKNQEAFFRLSILLFCIVNPNLKAEYKFEGDYKSEFLLPFNRSYAGDRKCPKNLPIKIQLKVQENKIIGDISNSSKCPNYQRALINGEIDNVGNIVKIKFNHFDKKWGPKDDAYKIIGNLKGQLILKSKQRMMYKDHKFFFTEQKLSENNEQYVEGGVSNDFKTEDKFTNDRTKKVIEELKGKELLELEEKELLEIEEKKLKKLKEKELIELEEKELEKQKRFKEETNLLFN